MDYLLEYAKRIGITDKGVEGWITQTKSSDQGKREAFLSLLSASKGDSLLAMCELVQCYVFGVGTPKSPEDAFNWAEKAARTGFAPGQYLLAYCLEEGIGIERDYAKASKLYEAAAEQGFRPAATRLAAAYSEGNLGKDKSKAVDYASLAANLGDSNAALMLAEWFEYGSCVVQDWEKAVSWYDKAAHLGNPLACLRLSMAYSLGQLGLSKDRSKAQIYENLGSRDGGLE